MKNLLICAVLSIVSMGFPSSVVAEKIPELHKEDFLSNARKQVEESENVIVVCVFHERLSRDVDYPVSKRGKISFRARIVSNVKGEMQIGKVIEFSYSIENWPGWLNDIERMVDARLHVLALDKEIIKVGSETIHVTPGAQVDWSYDVAKEFIGGLEKSLIK